MHDAKKLTKAIKAVAEELTEGDNIPSDNLVIEESITLAERHGLTYDKVCERLAKHVERITTRKRNAGVYG